MNREFLEGLGIEKDAIDKIMSENGKDIEKAKGNAESNSARVKELEKENESLKASIGDRDTQLEELKKNVGDNEELKKQIESLTAANEKSAEEHEKAMKSLKKTHAIENALSAASAKDVELVRKLIDESKVSLDDNGNLLGLEDQITSLKEGEVTKGMFGSGVPKMKGAIPGHGSDPEDSGTESEFQKRLNKYK